MRPIVTDRVALSVCRSVCHSSEPCKNRWTDRDAVWDLSGGPKETCIRWCCTLAPPGEYHWTVHVRRRCGLLSNYTHYLYCAVVLFLPLWCI